MTSRVPAVLLLLAATPAHADVADTLAAIGYVSSLAAGGIATAVNGSYLAFGEPAPRGWRIFGYAAGAVDVAWGGVILIAASDRTEGLVLGSLALAVGAASLATAFFVEEDVARPGVLRAAPMLFRGGGGVPLQARF